MQLLAAMIRSRRRGLWINSTVETSRTAKRAMNTEKETAPSALRKLKATACRNMGPWKSKPRAMHRSARVSLKRAAEGRKKSRRRNPMLQTQVKNPSPPPITKSDDLISIS
jgi:hypothetical protein